MVHQAVACTGEEVVEGEGEDVAVEGEDIDAG
jgi:hypothetical protein